MQVLHPVRLNRAPLLLLPILLTPISITDNLWQIITQATITQFLDVPKGRFNISVEPSLCMAFGTCERIAPSVFVMDKNKRINPRTKVESDVRVDFGTLLAAAHNCPTRAIKIVDRYTGEQICP